MVDIKLDATNWRKSEDFFESVYNAVGGPVVASKNINVFLEFVVFGPHVLVSPPFKLIVLNLDMNNKALYTEIIHVRDEIEKAKLELQYRTGKRPDVWLEIV